MDVHNTGPIPHAYESDSALRKRVPTAEGLKKHLEVTRGRTIKEFEEACTKLDAHEYATHDYRAIKKELNKCVELAKELAPESKQLQIDKLASALLETAKQGRRGYKQLGKAIAHAPVQYNAVQADIGAKKAAHYMKNFLEGIGKLKKHALTAHPVKKGQADFSPRAAIKQKVNVVLEQIEHRLEMIKETKVFEKYGVSKNEVFTSIKFKETLEALEESFATFGEQLPPSVDTYAQEMRDAVERFEEKFSGVKDKEKERVGSLFFEFRDLSNLYDAIKKADAAGDLPALQKLFAVAVEEGVIRRYVLSSFNRLLT